MLGRTVTIPARPERIAALSPTTVEYVYAVDRYSRTRTTSVKYPPEAGQAKDVGSAYQPNFELVAAEKPDIIIADSVLQPQLETNLTALSVPVVYAGAQNYEDVKMGLRLVGAVLGEPKAGEQAARGLDSVAESLRRQLPAQKLTVLILNGTATDFFAAKPESYVGSMLALLGAVNVAAGQPDVGQFPGYTKLSLETILASRPDVILAITAGPPGSTTIGDSLSNDPAWADVPAIKNKRVSEIDSDLYLRAPGPRANQGVGHLAELLYPDLFLTPQ
jgi:iron complex transport system substrate-binding protein